MAPSEPSPSPGPDLLDDAALEWRSGAYHYRLPDDQSPSEAVVALVTYCMDREVDPPPLWDQTPLFDVVDPDALDRLFSSRLDPDGLVEFAFQGYLVTLTSDRRLIVRPRSR